MTPTSPHDSPAENQAGESSAIHGEEAQRAADATWAEESQQEGPRRRFERVAFGVLAVVLLVVGTWFVVLTARGGHTFVVETPSMARTAPVGTLVVTEKVDPATLRVGEVISFRPPNIQRVYTHRIVEVTEHGFRTKGDLNGAPDGWVVPGRNVVGRAAHLWFGLGWLVKMAPWLALGGFLTAIARRLVRERNRASVTIIGSALSTALALVLVRPLLRAETIGFIPAGTDGVKISAIGTGLLPIRAKAPDGGFADLVAGQVGWVETHQADSHGRFHLDPALHLPWWGWLLLWGFCALPLLASLTITDDKVRDDEPGDVHDDDPDPGGGSPTAPEPPAPADAPRARVLAGVVRAWSRTWRPVAAGLSSLALAVAVSPSDAALTAAVSNSTNTAVTRSSFYATCLDAMRAYTAGTSAGTNGRLYAGYTLGSGTGVAGTADQGTVGRYTMTQVNVVQSAATAATQTGCQTDYTARTQQYITLNGTSSQLNLPAGSSVSKSTYDPGYTDAMTWNTWFRTTTSKGGVLSCPAGTGSQCPDRITWLNNSGQLVFGVATSMIVSPSSYNDGKWHMVTTQISPAGIVMWVDGERVASNAAVTSGDSGILYPQWGYSSTTLKSAFAAQAPTSMYYAGDMQMVSIVGRGGPSKTVPQDADVRAWYQSAFP